MSDDARAKILAAARACHENGTRPDTSGSTAEEDEDGNVYVYDQWGALKAIIGPEAWKALGLTIRDHGC